MTNLPVSPIRSQPTATMSGTLKIELSVDGIHTVTMTLQQLIAYVKGTGVIVTPPVESVAGTVVSSVGPKLVDSGGLAYTLVGSAGALQIARAGLVDATTSNVSQELYWNHLVYFQQASGWKVYQSGVAVSAAGDPRPVTPPPSQVESAIGSVVTSVGPKIVDSALNVYTINSAGQVVTNLVAETTISANVVQIGYFLVGSVRQFFQKNSGGNWYTRTSVTATYALATDPTAAPTFLSAGNGGLLLGSGWLSTLGNQIVDAASGTPVRLAAVNWTGGGGKVGSVPTGLNIQTIGAVLDGVKTLGFNCVRLSLSDVNIMAQAVNPTGSGLAANASFIGKPYLALVDAVVAYAGTIGLKILLAHVSNEGSAVQQLNGIWYDTGVGSDNTDGQIAGTISYAQFKANQVALATRYAGSSTVIGLDLDNEPTWHYAAGHGNGAYWDSSSNNWNMRYMVADVGDAVHVANPNLLLIVQCPLIYDATNNLYGTDCRLWDTLPSVSSTANKLVLSPHVFPSSVIGQATSPNTNSGSGAIAMYNSLWGFLVAKGTVPLFIGSVGYAGISQADKDWETTLASYVLGAATGGPTFTGNAQPLSMGYFKLLAA